MTGLGLSNTKNNYTDVKLAKSRSSKQPIKPLGRLQDLELANRNVNSVIFKLGVDIIC
jgi:hypothetical protein